MQSLTVYAPPLAGSPAATRRVSTNRVRAMAWAWEKVRNSAPSASSVSSALPIVSTL